MRQRQNGLNAKASPSIETRLNVYLSKHAAEKLPPEARNKILSRPLIDLLRQHIYSKISNLIRNAGPHWADFDIKKELWIENDGQSEESGNIASIVFVMLSLASAGGRSRWKVAGFMSGRLCGKQNLDALDNCWWLENNITDPPGHGMGKSFLRLIHGWLYKNARAARMYLQVKCENSHYLDVYK